MGHTNSTANLALPQFVGSDKPTWLGDINGAFSAIDAYVGTNDAAVAAAASDATSAVSQASAAVTTATNANTTAGNASTAANNAVGTANNAMSLVNQTNTKIGTLANLNTTDKTSIVNAINEVNAELSVTAWVNPDPTTDVSTASFASDIQYDAFLISYEDRADNNRPVVGSILIENNNKGTAHYMFIAASGHLIVETRQFSVSQVSDTYTFTFGTASRQETSDLTSPATETAPTDRLVPIRIIGMPAQS